MSAVWRIELDGEPRSKVEYFIACVSAREEGKKGVEVLHRCITKELSYKINYNAIC
jgi:hypothetical protein